MLKVSDTIRWMSPLDNDYTYGGIVEIKGCMATVKGIGIYSKVTEVVHLKYIQKVTGGIKRGSNKGDN